MNTLSQIRKPVHNRCFGIEIECYISKSEDEIIGKYLQFWYAGEDGSLGWRSNKIGVEFVSQPLPYKALIKQINYLSRKFVWQVDHKCGIHVHVSKTGCSLTRLIELAQRLAFLNDSQFVDLFGRAPNGYCKNEYSISSRYATINFTNKCTVEFRMFAGGDATWAKECLRRVKLMCEYKGIPTYNRLLELFTNPE